MTWINQIVKFFSKYDHDYYEDDHHHDDHYEDDHYHDDHYDSHDEYGHDDYYEVFRAEQSVVLLTLETGISDFMVSFLVKHCNCTSSISKIVFITGRACRWNYRWWHLCPDDRRHGEGYGRQDLRCWHQLGSILREELVRRAFCRPSLPRLRASYRRVSYKLLLFHNIFLKKHFYFLHFYCFPLGKEVSKRPM